LRVGDFTMDDLDAAEDLYDKEEAQRFFKLTQSASPHA
jgi:hypothetical protein